MQSISILARKQRSQPTSITLRRAGRRDMALARACARIAAALLLVVLLGFAPSTAFAGSNGQQIQIYGPAQRSVSICGVNQYDQYGCQSFNTPGYTWARIPDYWWKGTIKIGNYADYGARMFLGNTYCQVPAYQPSSDWTACYGVRARGNEKRVSWYWWGARLWLNHPTAEEAWQSVKASGSFSELDKSPRVPQPVKLAFKHISCISRFVNEVRGRDVGYGVVMDVNFRAPFFSCLGALKVWSQ